MAMAVAVPATASESHLFSAHVALRHGVRIISALLPLNIEHVLAPQFRNKQLFCMVDYTNLGTEDDIRLVRSYNVHVLLLASTY